MKGGQTTVIEALNAIVPGISIFLHMLDGLRQSGQLKDMISAMLD
jgi:hypothetical protein